MKSAKATISTKTFSIQALQFLAELHVQSAHDEEQHHGRDINHIMHKNFYNSFYYLEHPVTSYRGAVIKSWSEQVKTL